MNLSRILSGIVSIGNLQSFSCVLCSEISGNGYGYRVVDRKSGRLTE